MVRAVIGKMCVVREAFRQAVIENTDHFTKNIFVTAVMTQGYGSASGVNEHSDFDSDRFVHATYKPLQSKT